MSWTKVQAAVVGTRVTSAHSATVTINGVTAGSLIPVLVGIAKGTTYDTAMTVTDSTGDTVHTLIAPTLNTTPDMGVFYVKNASAGNHTFTINLGASDSCNICPVAGPEWSGGNTVDVASALSAHTSGAAISTPSISTTVNDDLVLFFLTQGGTADTYSSFNNSFVSEAEITGGPCAFIADVVQATKGNISGQCTSSSTAIWVSGIASFLLSVPSTSPTFISHTEAGPTASAASLTTAAIAVNQGDLVLVKYGDDGWNSGVTRTCAVATGSAISFDKIIDIGKYPSFPGNVVWAGFASATGNITIQVSCSPAQTFGITVEVWRQGAVGNYAAAYTSAASPNVSMTLNTNKNNSAVSFFSDDWNVKAPGTWQTGFVDTWSDQNATLGLTVESGNDPDIGASGAYTVGFSGTTYQSNNVTMNAVEIQYAPTINEPCSYMQTFAMR